MVDRLLWQHTKHLLGVAQVILPKTVILLGEKPTSAPVDAVHRRCDYFNGRLKLFLLRVDGHIFMHEVPWCKPVSTPYVVRHSSQFISLQEMLDSTDSGVR